jgi:hypothetical protein
MRLLSISGFSSSAVLSLCLAVGPGFAAVTTFHPAASLEVEHSDNVLYLDQAQGPVADWDSRLTVDLPLRRTGPRGSLEFGYRPSYAKYLDLSVLDHAEHRLRVLATTEPSRGSTLGFGLGYEKTQVQGVSGDPKSPDFFLTSRTDRDYSSGDFSWREQAGEKWEWTSGLRGARAVYTPISGLATGVPGAEIEDRTEYEFNVAPSREFSRASHAGVEYRLRRFVLAKSGDESVNMLSFTFDRTISRRASLTIQLGAFNRNATSSSTEAAPAVSESSNGLAGGFTLRETFRNGSLSLVAGHSPSAGGALRGTSTDSAVSLLAAGGVERRWRWEASAHWALRESTAPDAPSLTSAGGGASLEWLPLAEFGLRLGGDYVKQSGNDQAGLNGSFTTVRFGLTWYPRGPEEDARSAS